MDHRFLLEEVMLDGVSGEVRGRVEVHTGQIVTIDCQSFGFRDDALDCPTFLTDQQLAQAIEIAERALADMDWESANSDPMIISAERYSPPSNVSQQVLSKYLSTPRQPSDQQSRQAKSG